MRAAGADAGLEQEKSRRQEFLSPGFYYAEVEQTVETHRFPTPAGQPEMMRKNCMRSGACLCSRAVPPREFYASGPAAPE